MWKNLTRDLVRSRGLNDLEAARLYALVNTDVSRRAVRVDQRQVPVRILAAGHRHSRSGARRQSRHRSRSRLPVAASHAPVSDLSRQLRLPGLGDHAVFARYFGRDDIAFSITWAEPGGPGITRSYNSFRQLADEAAKSRVYGGIHFNFDTTSSFGVCVPLGEYVFDNTFRRRVP